MFASANDTSALLAELHGWWSVFFVLGTAEFTPASKATSEEARKVIGAWPGADVIRHTDRLFIRP